ncbi:MAG: CPBP family intramembrane metalloprotease, partial [Chloroflexi bacterium]|nr:CPBP family intramembrane metalloprotease [Chloroflexota bacterium]
TRIQGDITLEVVLAALLFAAAHITWSPAPFRVAQLDLFSLIYAFVMGVLNGVVLQKSRSVLYPLLMHSLSNVLMVGTGYLFAALF